MRIFADANVLLAACIEDHIHHSRAKPILNQVHEGEAEGYTSGHAVLELYAVMTRLPRSPRMLASQAMVMIQENVLKKFNLVALNGKEYGELVLSIGAQSALGGQAYDALHLACARKCDAERVYTFNVQHFQKLVHDAFRSCIVAP